MLKWTVVWTWLCTLHQVAILGRESERGSGHPGVLRENEEWKYIGDRHLTQLRSFYVLCEIVILFTL